MRRCEDTYPITPNAYVGANGPVPPPTRVIYGHFHRSPRSLTTTTLCPKLAVARSTIWEAMDDATGRIIESGRVEFTQAIDITRDIPPTSTSDPAASD